MNARQNLRWFNVNNCHVYLGAVLVFLAGVFLGSCGTEIGNGHSGPDSDRRSGKNKVGIPSGSANSPIDHAGTPLPTPVASNETPPQTVSGSKTSENIASNSGIGEGETLSSFDYNTWEYAAIFAECASVFGTSQIASPVNLKLQDALAPISEVVIISAINSNSKWLIKSGERDVLEVTPTGNPFQVSLKNLVTQQVFISGFTCNPIQTQTGMVVEGRTGTFSKYSVQLAKMGVITKVTWFLSEQTNAQGQKTLAKIIIEPTGAIPITLNNN